MEASLRFRCLRTPCFCEIPRNSHFSRFSSLSFVASPCCPFRAAMETASKQTLFRVMSEKKRIEAVLGEEEEKERAPDMHSSDEGELTCVMKFGGSSIASAERMREVAQLILSFPKEKPVIVLSAMGKTTNYLLLVLHNFFTLFGFCYLS